MPVRRMWLAFLAWLLLVGGLLAIGWFTEARAGDPSLPHPGGWDDRVYTAAHPGPFPFPPWAADWQAVAACESSNRWQIDTGNGYYGGLQFLPSTWRVYGGKRFAYWPNHATPFEQSVIAERVLWKGWQEHGPQGPGAWPVCLGE